MTAGAAVLTVADLEWALCAADPASLLVPPRILRRVIKKDSGLTGVGLQVPHRKSYVIRREALLAIADRYDLGLSPGRELRETLLLFPVPDPRELRALPPEATLLKYWRLLFHARVHLAVGRTFPEGPAAEAVLRERIHRIGQTESDEIRSVLSQENFLLHSHDLRSVYEEFVAVFLELHSFAAHRLPYYFPAIRDHRAVFRVLDADVNSAGLFAATRLAGAPDPTPASRKAEEGDAPVDVEEPPAATRPRATVHDALRRRAEKAGQHGNLVRAMLFLERAAQAAPPDQVGASRAAVAKTVEQLAARLQRALGFPDSDAVVWRKALVRLAAPAADGFWTREGRLLYDLQRVCIDQERDVFAVDLVEWIVTWGRRPIVRLLPHQRQVNVVRRLRGVALRLASARLPEADRKHLLELLHAAVGRNEEQMRDRFRPLLAASLEEAGLKPRSYAERAARDKIIEELLDRVVEYGFLSMSDLRDALARNRLKLPDLSGPGEFIVGDQLLRANRQLAVSLDGVYRGGEVYMRVLQRLSSLAFGTPVGRFLTLYLILPLGCAFVGLEGLQHVLHWIFRLLPAPMAQPANVAADVGLLASPGARLPLLAATTHHVAVSHRSIELVNEYSLPLTALFLLGVFHFPWFRSLVFDVLRLLWSIVRGVLLDVPASVLRLPPVRLFLQSRTYLLLYQFVLKPLMWAALVAFILYLLAVDPWIIAATAAGVFLAAEILLHSRVGMHLEEASADALLRGWRMVSRDVIPGLFRLVLAFFRRMLDDLERVLYTVDEWLRFRSGDSKGSLAVKAVLGLAWFFVTYVVRFCVNLLIEPQINPIKHFPVVTVSHKLVLAFFVPPMTAALVALQMNAPLAGTVAVSIGFCIPGIFGFLVWEFKENWRLYRANQPPVLRPQMAGGHGETIPRLLRPGFHSGTLPKLYARLRRFKGAGLGKPHEELHHVEEAVRRFVERNFLAMLSGSKSWGMETPLHVGHVHLASDRIRIELRRRGQAERSIHIDLEEHAGRLVAGITVFRDPDQAHPTNGWLDRLPLEQVRAFTDALAGFYKAAGVDLVREQVQTLLPPGAWVAYEDRGLVVRTPPHFDGGAVYDLQSEGLLLRPTTLDGSPAPRFRTLSADRLLFGRTPIRWDDWVEAWERDLAGKGHKPPLLRGMQILPVGTAKGRWAARRRSP